MIYNDTVKKIEMIKQKRPNMNIIERDIKSFQRPLATDSVKMKDYIYELEEFICAICMIEREIFEKGQII